MVMKPGDKIRSDLDGKVYEVIQYGPRDDLEPLPGVKLIGNCVIAKDDMNVKIMLYDWEYEKVE